MAKKAYRSQDIDALVRRQQEEKRRRRGEYTADDVRSMLGDVPYAAPERERRQDEALAVRSTSGGYTAADVRDMLGDATPGGAAATTGRVDMNSPAGTALQQEPDEEAGMGVLDWWRERSRLANERSTIAAGAAQGTATPATAQALADIEAQEKELPGLGEALRNSYDNWQRRQAQKKQDKEAEAENTAPAVQRSALERLGLDARGLLQQAAGSYQTLGEMATDPQVWVDIARDANVRESERAQRELTGRFGPQTDAALRTLAERAREDDEANPEKVYTPENSAGVRRYMEGAENVEKALEGMTGPARFAAETANSVVSNAPNMALAAFPVVGTALSLGTMGAQAAGGRAAELSSEGNSAADVLGRALASGAIEIATESVPVGNWAEILRGNSKSAVRNILTQMGEEGTEEAVSYLANYAADMAAQDPNASFSLEELLESAGMGAASGGIYGGVGVGINRLANLRSGTQTAAEGTQAEGETLPAPHPSAQSADTFPQGGRQSGIEQTVERAAAGDPEAMREALDTYENQRAEEAAAAAPEAVRTVRTAPEPAAAVQTAPAAPAPVQAIENVPTVMEAAAESETTTAPAVTPEEAVRADPRFAAEEDMRLTPQQQRLYDAGIETLGMTGQAAQRMALGWDGETDAKTYASGWQSLYRTGQLGLADNSDQALRLVGKQAEQLNEYAQRLAFGQGAAEGAVYPFSQAAQNVQAVTEAANTDAHYTDAMREAVKTGYKGQAPTVYMQAVNGMYDAGRTGSLTYEQAMKANRTAAMVADDNELMRRVFALGQESVRGQDVAAPALGTPERGGTVAYGEGVERGSTQVPGEVLDAFAQKFDIDIDVVRRLTDGDGREVNGHFAAGLARLTLGENSGNGFQSLAHEFVHYFSTVNPEGWAKLRNALLSFYTSERGMTAAQRVLDRYSESYGSAAVGADELATELFAGILTEENNMRSLLEYVGGDETLAPAEKRTIFKTLRDILDKVIERLRGLLRGGDATVGAAEGRRLAERAETAERCRDMVQEFLDELEGARQRGAGQMAEARKTNRNDGQSNNNVLPAASAGGLSNNTITEYSEDIKHSRPVSEDEDGQEQPYDITKPYAEQVRDAVTGNMPQREHDVLVGTTPKVLQDIGMGKLPITMTQHHANTIFYASAEDAQANNPAFNKRNGDSFHGMGDQLFELPQKLAEPVAIIKSQTRPTDSVVVLVEDRDSRGNGVMAAVVIGTDGNINGYDIDSNKAASYYGRNRNGVQKLLQNAISAELEGNPSILYLDTEKAIRPAQTAGVQFPGNLRKLHGLIHTIQDAGINVNTFEKITDTRQFHRFFDGSKVVDENGEPLVLYHQTEANFTVFDMNRTNGAGAMDFETPRGFYLKPTPKTINLGQKSNKNIKQMALYANIRNPLIADSRKQLRDYLKRDPEYRSLREKAEANNRKYQQQIDELEEESDRLYNETWGKPDAETAAERARMEEIDRRIDTIHSEWRAVNDKLDRRSHDRAAEFLRSRGFDGVHLLNDGKMPGGILETWIAFDNNQVKSATDNVGTFDPRVADINYSRPVVGDDGRGVDAEDDTEARTRLERENRELAWQVSNMQEQLARVRAEMRLSEGHTFSRNAIRGVASRILTEYESKYDRATLERELERIFAHIADGGPDTSYQEAMETCTNLMRDVIKQSSRVSTELRDYYRPVREVLRGSTIEVKEGSPLYNDLLDAFGDGENGKLWGNVRRATFGRLNLKLVQDAGNADTFFAELAQQYPAIFDEDAHPVDNIRQALGVFEASQPVYENPYGLDIDSAAAFAGQELFEAYMMTPESHSPEDRLRQQMLQLRGDMIAQRKAALARQAKSYEKKLDELRQQNRRRVGEVRDEIYGKMNDRLLKQKAVFEQRMERREERQNWRQARDGVQKSVRRLQRWLQNPTDQAHVPERMRKAVLDLLTSFDWNTSNAGTRAARDWRLAMKDLQVMALEMDNPDRAGDLEYIDFDPDLSETINELIEAGKGTGQIHALSAVQMQRLRGVLESVTRSITEANKLMAGEQMRDLQTVAEGSIVEMGEAKKQQLRAKNKLVAAVTDTAAAERVSQLLGPDMMDAGYYFRSLGPKAESIYRNIREGFDKRVWHLREAQEAMAEILKGHDVSTWTGPKAKARDFVISGVHVKLTPGQIMELYCLSQREQAKEHLMRGGITVDETSGKRRGPRVRLTPETLAEIVGTLTPEQVKMAQKMQAYLSTDVASWGYEVSMKQYGVRKFNEQFYWPIKSNQNFTRTSDATVNDAGLWGIKNKGMTKATVKGANNPIVLHDAFDTWAGHVAEMATYNAWCIPLSDAMKWYNYRGENEISVKEAIEELYGKKGQNYFVQLMKDINGTDSRGGGTFADTWGTLQSRWKVAKVGFNLRVAVQQPTAYLRAGAVLSPKYLAGALVKAPVEVGRGMREAVKYCAIAQWKNWGYFETNIGQSMRSILTGEQTMMERVQDKSTAMAELGDSVTWGTLWLACEDDVRDRMPELDRGSEAFKQAVAERLSEVIDRTQVVDTVLHRSQIMRSKDTLAKWATNFMAEPTKSYNMLREAAVDLAQGKLGARAKFARTFATFTVTALATAAGAGLIDALRSAPDKPEEDYGERYLDALAENFADNVNILNELPFVKDILSLLQGYDVSRNDMEATADTIDAASMWIKTFNGEGKATTYKLIYRTANALSEWTGLPVGGLVRELKSGYDLFTGLRDPLGLDEKIIKSSADLKNALAQGKTEHAQELFQELVQKKVDGGKDADEAVTSVKSAVTSEMKQRFMDGDSAERAAVKQALLDLTYTGPGGQKLHAYDEGDFNDWLNSEDRPTWTEAMQRYDLTTTQRLTNTLMQRKMAEGKTADEAAKSLRSTVTSTMKPLYVNGTSAERRKIENMLLRLKFNGKVIYDQKDLDAWLKK